MRGKSNAGETFQELLHRKLGAKQAHAQVESKESSFNVVSGIPVKSSKMMPSVSQDRNYMENKISTRNDSPAGITKDTTISDGNKSNSEVSSHQNVVEQDLQSNDVSGTDDFVQEANNAFSKRLRMYKCERCNSQYVGLAMLRQHCKDVHGDQKYYKCHVCGKLFSHPSSRNIHLRLHSGEKPYKCSTCGKQFRVSSHLKDHVRVHTGERPYICDICHKGFKQSSDLKKHRRTHTLDKPYKCPICPSAFTRSHHCRGHINSVHKFFKCVACSALFTSEEAFERHKEFHPPFFPDQSAVQSTTPDSIPPVQSSLGSSEIPDSAPKGTSERDSDIHEKNLKLDVANQLLELHKIPQHMTSPGKTSSSRSEATSESGDEVRSPPKQSSPVAQVVAVRSQVTATVMPLLAYQGASNHLRSADNMEERIATSPRAAKKRNGFHDTQMAEENTVRLVYGPQPSPQGVEYLKLPFQNGYCKEGNDSSPVAEINGNACAHLPSAVHMEERIATSPRATNKRNGFDDTQIAEENTARLAYGPQPSPQGAEYLKLPFQNCYRKEGGDSSPAAEMNGNAGMSPVRRSSSPGRNFSVHMFEQQKQLAMDQAANGAHYIANTHQQFAQHFAARAAYASQRRNSNFLENSARGENSQEGNAVMQKPSQSNNNVPCHRVSVIQYHSSVQKLAHYKNNQEHLPKVQEPSDPEPNVLPPSEPVTTGLENKPQNTNQQNQEMPQNHSPVDKDYLAGIPQERIPYVPLNSDSSIAMQSWNRELDELVGKYSWALKEAKKTYENLKIRDQAMQAASSHPDENKQFNVFSESNPQQSTGLLDRSQLTSVDMLKFLAREQIKQKDTEGDVKSPASAGEESETSEVSESGDVSNNGQIYSDARQHSSPSDLLVEQKGSPESSIHHCEVCKKTFSRSSLLKQHSVIHMGNKRFKFRCEVCGKMFRTRSHLRDHTRIHTGERPFKCHICQKAFKQSSDLKKHINLHTGANQFKCEECNMEFRRADALRKHKLGHKMGNMPCGHCGKNFLHISALRQHRAMHNVQPVKTNRAFHRCNYCFKTFTKAESYKIHMEEHTREQSIMLFDCKICSMKFFTQAEFTDHMNIHNGKRPYKCFVCEKEFCIAEHLQDHVRLHTDVAMRQKCEEGVVRFQGPADLVRQSAIHA